MSFILTFEKVKYELLVLLNSAERTVQSHSQSSEVYFVNSLDYLVMT